VDIYYYHDTIVIPVPNQRGDFPFLTRRISYDVKTYDRRGENLTMKRKQTEQKTGEAPKVRALVTKLNQYRHEYYNLAAPGVSDAVYDRLYDELEELEAKTGIVYADSPTQTVGCRFDPRAGPIHLQRTLCVFLRV